MDRELDNRIRGAGTPMMNKDLKKAWQDDLWFSSNEQQNALVNQRE
jgi:hypothetical protein